MKISVGAIAIALALNASAAASSSLTVPFDYSRGVIGVTVDVRGKPLFMSLDTGVNPSVIDLGRADALGLKVDRTNSGEGSGVGTAKHAKVYTAQIDGLQIRGRSFAAFDALAGDLSALSTALRRRLDGILGYSFLKGQIVLIDYAARTLSLLDRNADAAASTERCRTHYSIPMAFLKGENWPLIPNFRLGAARAPFTLDTGSNGGITLNQGALDLVGMRAALKKESEGSSMGLRGGAPLVKYRLDAPVGFGPFALPPGQLVTLRSGKASVGTRFGNVGNELFAAMTPMMLLDYRNRQMTFYGACK